MPRTSSPAQQPGEDIRTGMSAEALKRSVLDNLRFAQGSTPQLATRNDWYMALAYAIRDRLLDNWIKTISQYGRKDLRAVGYLSAEFLVGIAAVCDLGGGLVTTVAWEASST